MYRVDFYLQFPVICSLYNMLMLYFHLKGQNPFQGWEQCSHHHPPHNHHHHHHSNRPPTLYHFTPREFVYSRQISVSTGMTTRGNESHFWKYSKSFSIIFPILREHFPPNILSLDKHLSIFT